jgi:hypothetical protein
MDLVTKRCMAFMVLLTMGAGVLQADQDWSGYNTQCWDAQDYCCQTQCCERSKGRFFVGADLLYWTPRTQGVELDFGRSSIVQTTVGDDVTITAMDELDVDPKFKWNAGYRIAAGYQFACSDLEIDAFWTHFQSTGSRCVSGERDLLNSGKYRVKLDQFDVVMAYNVCLASSLTFKPFFGVRGTRIRQSVRAEVTTDILFAPDTLATGTRTWNDKQRFTGIGPVLGFQGDWNIGKGFGIYGSAAGSVLYGFDKIRFENSEVFSAPISDAVFTEGKKNLHRYNCNMDLAVGLRWQTCIMDKFQLTMKLGFEHHQYFNTSYLGPSRDDLCFDGGIFSIDFAL